MMFDNGENFMKILITGGTTFVSKFAAEYFVKSGNHVTVINRGSRKQIDGVNLICCDRMELNDTLKEKHYDVILDITAYTDEHIRLMIIYLSVQVPFIPKQIYSLSMKNRFADIIPFGEITE